MFKKYLLMAVLLGSSAEIFSQDYGMSWKKEYVNGKKYCYFKINTIGYHNRWRDAITTRYGQDGGNGGIVCTVPPIFSGSLKHLNHKYFSSSRWGENSYVMGRPMP